MESVLQEVNAAVGVTGCFVVGANGRLEARALPETYPSPALETVGRTLMRASVGAPPVAIASPVGDFVDYDTAY